VSKTVESNAYILGTDRAELHRLGLQHQIWASEAQSGWKKAGFTRGMHLLDLGSGPGFCTKEMAYIVGNEGQVTAVDKSKQYLDYLDKIATMHGLNINTQEGTFDELTFEADSFDGMFCRWAMAWISNPKEVLAKVLTALKPGAKMVLHEYYHWMAHQINPGTPAVTKAIRGCYDSFQDADGDIDVGRDLLKILSELGMKITSTRSMSKFARPQDIAWQWPRSFYEVYWPKIKEMGYLTEAELAQAFSDLQEIEKNPASTLMCPILIEVIAERI
jgi:ubiquinone/menaquinone biosynthesis C-methylase UbiE